MGNKYDDMVTDAHKTYTIMKDRKALLKIIDHFVERFGEDYKQRAYDIGDVNVLLDEMSKDKAEGTVADIIDVASVLELERVVGDYKGCEDHPFYPPILIHFFLLRIFEAHPGKKEFIYSLVFEKPLDDMATYINTVNFAAPFVRWRLRISK